MFGSEILSYNTLIVLVGTSLLGGTSGLIGTFAVLRRRSLTGDALAHAALPGLCLAFMVWGERNLFMMLLGAFISGLLGIGIISGLRAWTRIKEDAAIGIVLSVFFGAGIVLSRIIQNHVSSGSKSGLDSYILGKTAGMLSYDVYLIAALALGSLLVVLAFSKEFQLISFDTPFAIVQGWPALLLDLILMSLIAVVVVIGLPAVGVVMIAALLILPGASARFWSDRLPTMIQVSIFIGFLTGVVGTLTSATFSLMPAGPLIVLVGTAFFLFSVFFAPRRGVVSRQLREMSFRRGLARQRLLNLFLDSEDSLNSEISLTTITDSRAAFPGFERSLDLAQRDGVILSKDGHHFQLTNYGRTLALKVYRRDRLRRLIWNERPDLSAYCQNDEDLDDLLRNSTPEGVELRARLDRLDKLRSPPPRSPEELDDRKSLA